MPRPVTTSSGRTKFFSQVQNPFLLFITTLPIACSANSLQGWPDRVREIKPQLAGLKFFSCHVTAVVERAEGGTGPSSQAAMSVGVFCFLVHGFLLSRD
jgi:hypothetical protein